MQRARQRNGYGRLYQGICATLAWLIPLAALAQNTPIAGFQGLVGISLTDQFEPDSGSVTFFVAETSSYIGGSQLPLGGTPHFELALLDTGAAASLVTSAANAAFDFDGSGFDGTELQQLGGATGTFFAMVEDPLGIYATGLANRTSTAPLTLNTGTMVGQTSVSLLTLPEDSELPNILGLNFASQYATTIHADQPQITQVNGRTVRTPHISFGDLGTGPDSGILRRAPMTLKGEFTPLYIYNFNNILNGEPLTENPSNPTLVQNAGLFLEVNAENGTESINDESFFFDTGADVTVVSLRNAVKLGFDPILDEPEFTISVLGSGGTLEAVPGFFVDELTVATIGGTFTATHVPVLALDVTDVSDPNNIVAGIVGTNVFNGRNLVIDPIPNLGAGGSPSLFISDPVTSEHDWTTASASAPWASSSNWNAPGTPGVMWVANVRHVTGGDQQAVVSADSTVWELHVSGDATHTMSVRIEQGVQLTTFSGIEIQEGGNIHLAGGRIDAQFVEILGGSLSGQGTISVGNGPIVGQMESRGGIVAPGDGIGQLTIEGNFSSGGDATIQFELGGLTAGTQYDRLHIDGNVALGGTLQVELASLGGDLFAPEFGDVFTLITSTQLVGGRFDTLDLPTLDLPDYFQWDIDYTSTRVELSVVIVGDFNGDAMVGQADLDLVRLYWGAPAEDTPASWVNHRPNDVVGQYELDSVLLHWGISAAAAMAVPEPCSSTLVLAVGTCLLLITRRGRKSFPRREGAVE